MLRECLNSYSCYRRPFGSDACLVVEKFIRLGLLKAVFYTWECTKLIEHIIISAYLIINSLITEWLENGLNYVLFVWRRRQFFLGHPLMEKKPGNFSVIHACARWKEGTKRMFMEVPGRRLSNLTRNKAFFTSRLLMMGCG